MREGREETGWDYMVRMRRSSSLLTPWGLFFCCHPPWWCCTGLQCDELPCAILGYRVLFRRDAGWDLSLGEIVACRWFEGMVGSPWSLGVMWACLRYGWVVMESWRRRTSHGDWLREEEAGAKLDVESHICCMGMNIEKMTMMTSMASQQPSGSYTQIRRPSPRDGAWQGVHLPMVSLVQDAYGQAEEVHELRRVDFSPPKLPTRHSPASMLR